MHDGSRPAAWDDVELGEGRQALGRFPTAVQWGDVDLSDRLAFLAGGGDLEAGDDGFAIGVGFQAAEGELAVAQAVAEREERLEALFVEPFVADGRAFDIVVGGEQLAVGVLVAVEDRARHLVDRGGEGRRQVPRRVDLAGQDAGNGLAAGRTREPGFDDGADLVQPRHHHRAAGFQHDDGLRVGLGDGGDQRILFVGQAEVGHVHAFGGPLGGEDDDDVALGRHLRGGGDVLTVGIGHLGRGPLDDPRDGRGGEIDHRPREGVWAFIRHGHAAARIDLAGPAT